MLRLQSRKPLSNASRLDSSLPLVAACHQPRVGCQRRPRLLQRHLAALFPTDTIHVSETSVVVASIVGSLALPALATYVATRRLQALSPHEALRILTDGAVLVDVRDSVQSESQGQPSFCPASPDYIMAVPWMTADGGGRNTGFEEEVLFSLGEVSGRTFVVMDGDGRTSLAAAQCVSRLGNKLTVYTIEGGFKGWQAAGLATIGGQVGAAEEEVAASAPADAPLKVSLATQLAPIFRPKLLDVLTTGYNTDMLRQDVLSGMVVGVVALSLSMALGIASESTPAVGLYTAVVSGFLISALGGSRVCIGGPTAAFIPIVLGLAHDYGPQNLVICTGLAGAILVAMGATGLGSIIRFIPKPVVTGFTAGIATYIFSTQAKDFLGLGVPGHLPDGALVPPQFLEKLYFITSHLDAVHPPSLALAALCLALMAAWPKDWAKVAPPQIMAVVGGTAFLALLQGPMGVDSGVETIGSHFGAGAIPQSLPWPHFPPGLDLATLPSLIYPATTLAVLAAVESLLCARVSDTMMGSGDKHNPNTELIAQGLANLASASVGGLPATGALARTAANIRAGGQTPVAGMVHAATILAVMSVAAPLAENVPLPTLSAILVIVALNMGEWQNFKALRSWPEKDAQLFLLAFFLTVLQDVAMAVELGMVAAVLYFVADVTSSLNVRSLPGSSLQGSEQAGTLVTAGASSLLSVVGPSPLPGSAGGQEGSADTEGQASPTHSSPSSAYNGNGNGNGGHTLNGNSAGNGVASAAPSFAHEVPAGSAFLEVTGSLLFGAGEVLEQAVGALLLQPGVKVVVLSLCHVSTVDVSGLEVLEEQTQLLHKAGKELVLCSMARQPLRMLSRAGFFDEVGRANVCRTVEDAFRRSEVILRTGDTGRGSLETRASPIRLVADEVTLADEHEDAPRADGSGLVPLGLLSRLRPALSKVIEVKKP